MDQLGVFYVTSNSPVQQRQNVTIIAFLENPISGAIFLFSYGDGSSALSIEEFKKSMVLPDWVDPPFQTSGIYVFMVEHNYTAVGLYQCEIHATWRGQEVMTSTDIYVQARPCDPPKVQVLGGGAARNTSLVYRMWRPIPIQAIVTLSCPAASRASFTWSVHAMGSEVSVTSAANAVTLPEGVLSNSQHELIIPAYALAYGDHIAQLKVWHVS